VALAKGRADGPTNGQGRVDGVLEVLASGPVPPDAGEFVGTKALATILERLSERFDFVLIDAPPLLHVGDAMTLSSRIDALLLVTRLDVIRRPMLAEMRRLLQACPSSSLGFVLTDAHLEETYGYAGYYRHPGDAEVERTEEVLK
jgi:Mrp family chromosome partitioning ATPase